MYALVTVGDTTILGGTFSAVTDTNGVSYPAANLAVMDNATGSMQTTWTGSTDGEVTALAVSGSTLYVGGNFSNVDGTKHRKLAALNLADGQIQPAFRGTVMGKVHALAATPSSLFVAGAFSSVNDGVTTSARDNVEKVDALSGAIDTGWAPTPNAAVLSLLLSPDNSTLYLGGDFTSVNSTASTSFSAAVSTADPAVLRSYRSRLLISNSHKVLAEALDNGVLYLATNGTGGSKGGSCIAVNATTGVTQWIHDTDGNGQAVTVVNGVAYFGGHFATINTAQGNVIRHHLVAFSTTYPYSILPYAPNVNSAYGIGALTNDGTNIYLGGGFTKVGGRTREHVAILPGD